MAPPMRQPSEVTLWASDLQEGALPWICIRSGRPASNTIRVQFQNKPDEAWAGLLPGSVSRRYVVKGRLPVTMLWLTIMTTTRFLLLGALVGIGYGFWAVTFQRDPSPLGWTVLLASLAVFWTWRIFRSRLEPTGVMYRVGDGRAYVHLHGLHPNFVANVEARRAATPASQST